MHDRGTRRASVARIIARRERQQEHVALGGSAQKLRGHRLAKRDGLGRCSNRGCWLCAYQRWQKRSEARKARRSAIAGDS